MRILALVAFATIAVATPSTAQQIYRTKKDYAACTSKENVKTAIRLAAVNSRAFSAYMADPINECVFLRAEVRVYIESRTLTLVEIRAVGSVGTLWTPREAVTQ